MHQLTCWNAAQLSTTMADATRPRAAEIRPAQPDGPTARTADDCQYPVDTRAAWHRPKALTTVYAIRVCVMAHPGAEVLNWASAVLGSPATVVRGLRDGGSPWLLRVGNRGGVLRVAHSGGVAETATEVAAMTLASQVARAALPVAELLGYDLAEQTGYGLVLTARVPGTSMMPPEPDPERLRALGAVAAQISSIKLIPTPTLP